ncbi:MAG: hypothetical protein BWY63_00160 [Chloroflexi bacterium ADurb.Bin360]|nr:MAG: hypothetical protein BWY63_00160 [Chloroflexi bacterium ADurb.Bin360]
MRIFTSPQNPHSPVAEHGERGTVEPDFDAFVLANLIFQPCGDIYATCAGIDGVDRTEEAVRLQHEFPAKPVLIIHQQAAHTALP